MEQASHWPHRSMIVVISGSGLIGLRLVSTRLRAKDCHEAVAVELHETGVGACSPARASADALAHAAVVIDATSCPVLFEDAATL